MADEGSKLELESGSSESEPSESELASEPDPDRSPMLRLACGGRFEDALVSEPLGAVNGRGGRIDPPLCREVEEGLASGWGTMLLSQCTDVQCFASSPASLPIVSCSSCLSFLTL